MSKPIYDDPVVAEIHAIREKMLADCGGSMEKLMDKVKANEAAQAAAGRRIITEPLRRRTETPPAPMPPIHPGSFPDLSKLYKNFGITADAVYAAAKKLI
jgi:hypothetical protein